MSQHYDVGVVGGGLAGGVAALKLARAGCSVVLCEKEAVFHHKVCGEFVSAEGSEILLREAGIDLKAMGASPIHAFRFHSHSHTIERDLPLHAWGFSRARLDEMLLQRANEAGAEVKNRTLVRGLSKHKDLQPSQFEFEIEDRQSQSRTKLRARQVILASGKTDFKDVGKRVGKDSGYIGYKMHFRLRPKAANRLAGHCDLFVFDGGYGGLASIEDGKANFCFLISKEKLQSLKQGTKWNSVLEHLFSSNHFVSDYLHDAEAVYDRPVTIANIPYGFVNRGPYQEGLYAVGDQMAVIPSLTGDGMSIALATGKSAAEQAAFRCKQGMSDLSTHSYQTRVAQSLKSQVRLGYLLHQLFKHPEICDAVARVSRYVPLPIDFAFHGTRCRLV